MWTSIGSPMRGLASRRSLGNRTLHNMATSSNDTLPRDYHTISIHPKDTTGTSTGPSSGWMLAVAGRSAQC